MDVQEAVRVAKSQIVDVFTDEKLDDIGLEEVEYDSENDEWRITIGFSRPWDEPASMALISGAKTSRTYKVVRIADDDGEMLSIKSR